MTAVAGRSNRRTILITGAGIAGLTSALALAKSGYRAEIFEKSPRLSEVGAGLQISPNASRILIDLGLGDKLDEFGVKPSALKLFNARNGHQLTSIPLAQIAEERYGAPYYVIHRADLQAMLLRAAKQSPDIKIHFDHAINEVASHTLGVTIQSWDGHEATGRALIAADGLHSYVRQRIVGDGDPSFAKYVAWRGMVPVDNIDPEFQKPFTGLWLSKSAHIVHYPVRGGKLINVVVIVRNDTPQTGWANHGKRDELLSSLRHLAPQILSLIKGVDAWLTWALFDRGPAPLISRGQVTLVGDAAHPMLPFLAQGAAMAIEDAAAIADAISMSGDDFEGAFKRYEEKRLQRTARVQTTARRNGKIYHASGPIAFLRDQKIRNSSAENLLARFDWLYSHR